MVDNVRDIELGTLTSGGWDTSAAPVASTANVWQSTSDPTVSADISIGVRRGDVWINTASGNEFRCISHAASAAIWRHVPRLLGYGNTILSHTGDTAETVKATVSVPANAMGANGILRIDQIFSNNNSGNNKTFRTRLGTSGNGLTGTIYSSETTTTNIGGRRHIEIVNRNATNSQIGANQGATPSGWGATASANQTSSLDATAVIDIAMTVQLANGGDTGSYESYRVTLTRPDIGP